MLVRHDQNAHLTVAETAQVLNVSCSWLNKARLTGDGPIYAKIGRRVVYSTNDLDEWLEKRKFASTSAYF
jgi:predicted DNA-binding transcriptional regulator AlpA